MSIDNIMWILAIFAFVGVPVIYKLSEVITMQIKRKSLRIFLTWIVYSFAMFFCFAMFSLLTLTII
jgi:hypothetical protein